MGDSKDTLKDTGRL